MDMADGDYDPENRTLTYNTTFDKLFPPKYTLSSSFVCALQNVPLASGSDFLKGLRLKFINIVDISFYLKHTQFAFKPHKDIKRNKWTHTSDTFYFRGLVDYSYPIDDSTSEKDLVNGLLVESEGTEIDLTSDPDESKAITVNSSLPKKISSTSDSHSCTTSNSKTTASYKYTVNSDSRTWLNNYIAATTMTDDCRNYHDCYHNRCETTTTDRYSSSGGGYSSGGGGGGVYSGGHDSGGGCGDCDF
ncbi:unnamed protein product [Ambrosiozyma monospora]|uniref:Unnamed protein product n=1 Tax=Ambrosiozyma monospora TaxID=43982 RepID=A0ACB5TAG2_AMBMO|nr:unnamed protein product [Ambrosiozyma monospora]